jgi:hypothetical protein
MGKTHTMGNRATIAFPKAKVSLYLHWNGGVESLVAFLDYANEVGISDDDYGAARFTQIIANYFGGTLSIGLSGYSGKAGALDDGQDNGAYVIERGETGLRVATWLKRAAELAGPELACRIERARAHTYNTKGEMLAELRTKNDPFFKAA